MKYITTLLTLSSLVMLAGCQSQQEGKVSEGEYDNNFFEDKVEYSEFIDDAIPYYSINGISIHSLSRYWHWYDYRHLNLSFKHPAEWYIRENPNNNELFVTNSYFAYSLDQLSTDEIGILLKKEEFNDQNSNTNNIFPCENHEDNIEVKTCEVRKINWNIYKIRDYIDTSDNSYYKEYATESDGQSLTIRAKMTDGINQLSRASDVSRLIETMNYDTFDFTPANTEHGERDWHTYIAKDLGLSIEIPFEENEINFGRRGATSLDGKPFEYFIGNLNHNKRSWDFLEAGHLDGGNGMADIHVIANYDDKYNSIELSNSSKYWFTVVDQVNANGTYYKIFDYSRDYYGIFLPKEYGIYARPGRAYAVAFNLPEDHTTDGNYHSIVLRFLEEDVNIDELKRIIRSIKYIDK